MGVWGGVVHLLLGATTVIIATVGKRLSYDTALGLTYFPVQWIPSTLLEVTRPGRGAGHSPPGADVKNERSCTSVTSYTFMACRRISPYAV